MQVKRLSEPAEFARLAEPVIAADPLSTSVLAGMLARILRGEHPPADAAWMLVEQDGQTVGVAMHTPPNQPFVPRLPRGAAAAIAKHLLKSGRSFTGVVGERDAVDEFADCWVSHTGGSSSVVMSMRMYRLGMLQVPSDVPGSVRCAQPADVDLVADWFARFHLESAPDSPEDDPVDVARRRIDRHDVWLWVDTGGPVSLAVGSEPAAGVSRVAPVYTPPEFRRRGYAAAITARATQACLDRGAADVVLYTDLANPVSNSIYQAIGYRPDHDAQQRLLTDHREVHVPDLAR